jgi:transcription elongation factor Elf1
VSPEFTFDCPECDVETTVDADVRAEILDAGCVLCRTSVSAEAFSGPAGPGPDATP